MEIVNTTNAPQAIGPYSQAVKANGFLFCSGQIPLSKEGDLIEGDVGAQCTQVMDNLKAVLEAAGSDLSKVVKTTIYLATMDDFAAVNEVYAGYFGDHKPARATVAVKTLPKSVAVEIDCIAIV
ncbi:RidA family protein [Patescibacteria group bacterium]|nr:RidA family protein [Patescibacteria group bacterium]